MDETVRRPDLLKARTQYVPFDTAEEFEVVSKSITQMHTAWATSDPPPLSVRTVVFGKTVGL